MLKRLLLSALLGATYAFPIGGTAEAQSCRSLELQLMQAQASRDRSAYSRVRNRMVSSGCLRQDNDWQPFGRILQQPQTIAPSRPARQARPEQPRRREARRSRDEGAGAERQRMTRVRGTYRTLCVRTCDGYYFPISFSTTREHFEADQATCSRLCPEAEASIYYHTAREGPESMVSLEGSAYLDLPTAFKYRSDLDPSCSCGRPAAPMIVAETAASSEADAVAAAQAPRPRSTPGEDPETLANRDGRFVPRSSSLVAAGEPGSDGQVRVIGQRDPGSVIISTVPNNFPFDAGVPPASPGPS